MRSKFLFIFLCFSCCFGATCNCCRLVTMINYLHFGMTFVCHYRGAIFICESNSYDQSISSMSENKSNQWSSICCRIDIIDILVKIVISNV